MGIWESLHKGSPEITLIVPSSALFLFGYVNVTKVNSTSQFAQFASNVLKSCIVLFNQPANPHINPQINLQINPQINTQINPQINPQKIY